MIVVDDRLLQVGDIVGEVNRAVRPAATDGVEVLLGCAAGDGYCRSESECSESYGAHGDLLVVSS
ncbi:hypothetical protein D9M71_828420 [compost metagenome]